MDHICKRLIALIIIFAPYFIYGQTPVNVYTPQGTRVADTYKVTGQYTEAQKEYYKSYVRSNYPRAVYWGEADPTYNCHAYAWSVTEGGEKVWMGYSSNPTSVYWNDGSYISTNESDPQATKISYASDNHSAVKSSGNYFLSKWGALCLVKHRRSDCPYNSRDLRFYKVNMAISGDDIVVLPSPSASETREYTLSNVPAGARVEWKGVYSPSSIISGQGTNKVKISLKESELYLSAKVHCTTGTVVYVPSFLIRTSYAPIITDIEMFKYGQETGEFTVRAVTNNPSAEFRWYVQGIQGGNATLCELPYPSDATFLEYPNVFKAIHFYETGSYTITVTGSTNGFLQYWQFSKTFDITERK